MSLISNYNDFNFEMVYLFLLSLGTNPLPYKAQITAQCFEKVTVFRLFGNIWALEKDYVF